MKTVRQNGMEWKTDEREKKEQEKVDQFKSFFMRRRHQQQQHPPHHKQQKQQNMHTYAQRIGMSFRMKFEKHSCIQVGHIWNSFPLRQISFCLAGMKKMYSSFVAYGTCCIFSDYLY